MPVNAVHRYSWALIYTHQASQTAGKVRIRWIGHNLRAECEVIIDPDTAAVQAHQVTVAAEHDLLHAIPRLSAALVHADPQPHGDTDFHQALASHRQPADPAPRYAPRTGCE